MGKTVKGKDKIAVKKAALAKKITRKCKGKCAVAALLLLAVIGCAQSGPQPSRAIYQRNDFADCRFDVKVYGGSCATNEPSFEMFTNTQANEGSETMSPTSTPTLDVKTDITAKYNDAISRATDASRGVLETLMLGSANKVLGLMADNGTGTVNVTKKDGTAAVVRCENGQCSYCEDCRE